MEGNVIYMIAIGADHGGYKFKEEIKKYLEENGIEFEDVSPSLESLKEEGVFFLGELLDYDAPCGGHNLMWAIGTGLYLANKMA